VAGCVALLLGVPAWNAAGTGSDAAWPDENYSPRDVLRQMGPGPRASSHEPGLPFHGAVLPRMRDCLRCHRLGAEGRQTGVDLTNVGRYQNAAAIERRLANPRGVDPEATMPTPPLTRGEISAIAEYLAGLH
jgi:hypothetical protein